MKKMEHTWRKWRLGEDEQEDEDEDASTKTHMQQLVQEDDGDSRMGKKKKRLS